MAILATTKVDMAAARASGLAMIGIETGIASLIFQDLTCAYYPKPLARTLPYPHPHYYEAPVWSSIKYTSPHIDRTFDEMSYHEGNGRRRIEDGSLTAPLHYITMTV
jgi:hypothetical protein